MLPEITGGCVRYDKIAFVLFPVGSPGFLRFLRFQTVTGGLRADIAQKVALQFLFLPDSGFQPFQSGKALLRGGVGCGNGSVQLVRGRKAILLVEHEGSRHLFEVVHGRPLLIAPSFPLGSLGGYVYHALYSVIVRGVFRFFFRP